MDENVIVVSHVSTEMDADCAVAALSDAGINAAKQYINAPGGSTLFALPGAMGFGASEGYDILVSKEAEEAAREVLIGVGFAEPSEKELTEDESHLSEEITSEEITDSEKTEAAAVSESTGKASALLMILFLAAAALFVIGVDKVIELIKSFF